MPALQSRNAVGNGGYCRRRAIQQQHNEEHGIRPQSIVKDIRDLTDRVRSAAEDRAGYSAAAKMPKAEIGHLIEELEQQMKEAAARLEFEKAALLRDQILELRKLLEDDTVPEWERIWQESHGPQARKKR